MRHTVSGSYLFSWVISIFQVIESLMPKATPERVENKFPLLFFHLLTLS